MIEAQTHLTTMFLLFILISCCFGVASPSYCPRDEYKAGMECCPSCPPGWYVVKDCEERSMTKCSSCPDGTFQAGRNEQKQCSTCTKCDAGLGLKVKKSCSSTSDAVCEVLDGFFCSDSNGGGRMAAQRHTVCSPGYYIGQRGTADTDTECLHCNDGTFSDGASSSCQSHSICDSKELKQVKPGTDSTDSECGEHGPHRGLVARVIPGVILVMALMGLIIAIIHRKKIREKANLIHEKKKKRQVKEEWGRYKHEPTPLRSTDGPQPTREYTITIPDGTIVDPHGDQSLGPAPPSSPTDNGSVSVSVHQEDHQPVLIKRDNGAFQSTLLSLGPPSSVWVPPPLPGPPPSVWVPPPPPSQGEGFVFAPSQNQAASKIPSFPGTVFHY